MARAHHDKYPTTCASNEASIITVPPCVYPTPFPYLSLCLLSLSFSLSLSLSFSPPLPLPLSFSLCLSLSLPPLVWAVACSSDRSLPLHLGCVFTLRARGQPAAPAVVEERVRDGEREKRQKERVEQRAAAAAAAAPASIGLRRVTATHRVSFHFHFTHVPPGHTVGREIHQ